MNKTDINGDVSVIKTAFIDTLGTVTRVEADFVGKFVSWRFQDWQGTGIEHLAVHGYTFSGITVALPEINSQDYYNGMDVVGTILNITDTHDMVADSAFMQKELIRYVENTIAHLFETAKEQNFEVGMESDFSRELVFLVKSYGMLAMNEICYLITHERINSNVASEAIRWLAHMDDPLTYSWRLWLLEKSLESNSPIVRDSAVLGLISLCDADAIQYIEKAIERETIDELRYDLQGALQELKFCLNAITTTKD